MIIGVDFDGTIVKQGLDYGDLDTPLELLPGAKEGLASLVRAGHILILVSARANLALREDWRLNPLWVRGAVPFDLERWQNDLALNQARYHQMVEFVEQRLPTIFAAIDDGCQGKVTDMRLMIDDIAHRFVEGEWEQLAYLHGEAEEEDHV